MAEKNADGLVVRYGLEQIPDVVLKAASDCQKAYVVDMKGPMVEMALDLMIPAGTYIPDVVLINDAPFETTDTGKVSVTLVKKEDGSTVFKTLLDEEGYSTLNSGAVIFPSYDDSGDTPVFNGGFITPYDCIVKVVVKDSTSFSAEGKARLILSAITSA